MENVVESGSWPTLRVLSEHLQDPSAWENAEQLRAINAGNFRSVLPLSKLTHMIIVAGNNRTADGKAGDNLIVYRHSVTIDLPSLWRELRRDPWRGLVTQPFTGTEWWLVHAGIRRQGDRSNVYQLTDSANRSDLLKFYPTQDDRELLDTEKSMLAQLKWKSACLVALVDEIAAVGGGTSRGGSQRALPENPTHPGCHLDFEVTLDRLDRAPEVPTAEAPAEVFVNIRILDWADEVVRRAIVPLLMGFIDPAQENWTAYSPGGKTTTYSVLISESRLAQLIAAATIP